MSFTYDSIWPMRVDLSSLECRQMLREKELLCYSDIVSVFRAQGPLSEEKKSLLFSLQKLFSIPDERHKIELRRAANNEKLTTIAEKVSGFDAYSDWALLGALKMPDTNRPKPRPIFFEEASQTMIVNKDVENELPSPPVTKDNDLSLKYDSEISRHRMTIKVKTLNKNEQSTNAECLNEIVKKEGLTNLDYNLHLLSEIATGESTEPGVVLEQTNGDIKPDAFSILHQIDDIELPNIVHEANYVSHSQLPSTTKIPLTTLSSNGSVKTLTNTGHDPSIINLAGNSKSMWIGNNTIGQRYVPPRTSVSKCISATNQQRQIPGFIGQSQASSGYFTIGNNQLRSPLSHQLGCNRTGHPPTQQFFIQNVSPPHGSNTIDNFTSLGYTLQQRAVRAEQHQTNNKHNFIVRNLGSQPTVETERNKRLMVVKGCSSTGPSIKKPKISNPSNRQPGRPPLMPAPSSAYASRPYVANEIFQTKRTSSIDCAPFETNGVKVTAPPVRTNAFYSVSRGNGAQRKSGELTVQSGSGLRSLDGTSNPGRVKNIQPVISVVPLSPKRSTTCDSIVSGNISIYDKEENIAEITEKDLTMPKRVISKNEAHSHIMDRVNPPMMFSYSQTANETH